MKYVRLVHPQPHQLPRIALGLAPQSHADIAEPSIAEGYVPRTAGFLRILPSGHFETFGESVSLRLSSHPDDARLIYALHRASVETARPAGEVASAK
jgi:hypothetical protein